MPFPSNNMQPLPAESSVQSARGKKLGGIVNNDKYRDDGIFIIAGSL